MRFALIFILDYFFSKLMSNSDSKVSRSCCQNIGVAISNASPWVIFICSVVTMWVNYLDIAGIYLLKVKNKNTRTMPISISLEHVRKSEVFLTFLRNIDMYVVLVSLLLTLNRFHTLHWCLYCWLWTSTCRLGMNVATCLRGERKT